jgi:hypothetical protein
LIEKSLQFLSGGRYAEFISASNKLYLFEVVESKARNSLIGFSRALR